MKKNISSLGFTIVELLIVIIIIGILATITIVQYNGAQAHARDLDRRADVANITKALEQYYADNGSYPVASGTASVINSNWYTSGDASWTTFATNLSGIIDTLPTDPKAIANSNPLNSGSYAYAYYTGSYCGKTAGRWYLLVYRYEYDANEKFSDGDCSTNPLGDAYYTAGASYYRVVK